MPGEVTGNDDNTPGPNTSFHFPHLMTAECEEIPAAVFWSAAFKTQQKYLQLNLVQGKQVRLKKMARILLDHSVPFI